MQFERSNPDHEMPTLIRTGRENSRLFFCPMCMDRFTVSLSDPTSSATRAKCDRCRVNWRWIDFESGVEDEAAEALYAGFVPFSARKARSSRNLDQ